MMVGYARVSTSEQETDLQVDALRRHGVRRIYLEKGSGVGPRPQLQKLLASLQAGDTLVVWKLDRVARSMREVLNVMDVLKQRSCDFRSLTEPIDTSHSFGELTLQMIAAFAQFERSLIRERTIAGQVAAYRRGVKLGRHRHATSEETVGEMRALYATGQWTYPDVAAFFGVHPSTAKRLITGRGGKPRMPVLGAYL